MTSAPLGNSTNENRVFPPPEAMPPDNQLFRTILNKARNLTIEEEEGGQKGSSSYLPMRIRVCACARDSIMRECACACALSRPLVVAYKCL